MINKSGHKGLGMKLKDLIEKRDDAIEDLKDIEPTPRPDTKTKDGKKDFIVEILEAWKEARTYDDLHLFDDHTNWLRFHFNNGSFEFPDDYDFDTNVWTIGKLIAQVEPYNFKEKFTIPKFVINAASDEFFVTDSWQFYWDDLPGEKHLRYVPNAGHSLEGTYQLENLASFYYRFLHDLDQPNWTWEINNDTIFVNIGQGQDYKLAKWEVNNPKERDFRIYKIGKTWQKIDIEINNEGYYAIPVSSNKGYTATLVEVIFDSESDRPLILSTGTVVTPNKYPFEKYTPEKSLGTKKN